MTEYLRVNVVQIGRAIYRAHHPKEPISIYFDKNQINRFSPEWHAILGVVSKSTERARKLSGDYWNAPHNGNQRIMYDIEHLGAILDEVNETISHPRSERQKFAKLLRQKGYTTDTIRTAEELLLNHLFE